MRWRYFFQTPIIDNYTRMNRVSLTRMLKSDVCLSSAFANGIKIVYVNKDADPEPILADEALTGWDGMCAVVQVLEGASKVDVLRLTFSAVCDLVDKRLKTGAKPDFTGGLGLWR